ncbi:hypothetical protein T492DRAFT_892598, partial [Pavlovales sp. CCMP2436]
MLGAAALLVVGAALGAKHHSVARVPMPPWVCPYPDPLPNPPLAVKACYTVCEANAGDTPCQHRQCKDACWYGNDFCYGSCMGGCYPWAYNSSIAAVGCSSGCQIACGCGLYKGHCWRPQKTCVLSPAITDEQLKPIFSYLCTPGNAPDEVGEFCKGLESNLPAECSSRHNQAVALVSYFYSLMAATGKAASTTCDFSGYGVITTHAGNPCAVLYESPSSPPSPPPAPNPPYPIVSPSPPPNPPPFNPHLEYCPSGGGACSPTVCGPNGEAQCCQDGHKCPGSTCPVCNCPDCSDQPPGVSVPGGGGFESAFTDSFLAKCPSGKGVCSPKICGEGGEAQCCADGH